ncbi:uncharacterized protein UMAG_01386 [Mycosarcoma maydis]|uniref:Uncharacterized protein n=1 Tax=Mycosarcoma maydis TaxID=5270 RepID=A0A0D1E7M4_MYCMD|nr:uncharacterized protein UMAG_01386 [Ustilago maydis 521]KIS71491.1 hypothetical protein UMAG_01386 [Ustilago maydis 521]|eukprot:XP_011387271.1 hypothetical protein UMAG_01386 [Ustilago maydis 521]
MNPNDSRLLHVTINCATPSAYDVQPEGIQSIDRLGSALLAKAGGREVGHSSERRPDCLVQGSAGKPNHVRAAGELKHKQQPSRTTSTSAGTISYMYLVNFHC